MSRPRKPRPLPVAQPPRFDEAAQKQLDEMLKPPETAVQSTFTEIAQKAGYIAEVEVPLPTHAEVFKDRTFDDRIPECRSCQWYIAAVLRSDNGQIKVRFCGNAQSPLHQTMSGPLNSCEAYVFQSSRMV